MGPNSDNFSPNDNTKIYINSNNLKQGEDIIEKKNTTSIGQTFIYYQLRQLRSKFHCLSTYALCRSCSTTIKNIAHRPYTIWTLCEYDSPQSIDSQAKKLSRIFQAIAKEVLENGSHAKIKVDIFQKLYDAIKDGKTKDKVGEIIKLEESGFIIIINNAKLSKLLQPLADSMLTS